MYEKKIVFIFKNYNEYDCTITLRNKKRSKYNNVSFYLIKSKRYDKFIFR